MAGWISMDMAIHSCVYVCVCVYNLNVATLLIEQGKKGVYSIFIIKMRRSASKTDDQNVNPYELWERKTQKSIAKKGILRFLNLVLIATMISIPISVCSVLIYRIEEKKNNNTDFEAWMRTEFVCAECVCTRYYILNGWHSKQMLKTRNHVKCELSISIRIFQPVQSIYTAKCEPTESIIFRMRMRMRMVFVMLFWHFDSFHLYHLLAAMRTHSRSAH